ncbi:alpha/beta fold hydrolase [Tenacibaculum sp. SG-28]|uniref:alpha/beta fold hydrolase n=1 Tax=Tenacibaculum sp. SG-28 TaxID=754426 RepID=UPI000CF38959|nr:alpha/beta hydrolase [Tenacibaculum sp. SG-28]PQJ21793.1 hypothetical protein BSU00_06955 [Tenacibaculum sp. SG-28]
MCTEALWKFIFPKLENINPIPIAITHCKSFEEINNEIAACIESPAVLVGFSLGGFIAMNFACNYPEKITKLIVIAANSSELKKKELQLRNQTITFLEKNKYAGITTTRMYQFLHEQQHKNQLLLDLIRNMDKALGKEILIRQLKATSFRSDISEKLKNIKIPVILIAAEDDRIVSFESVKTTAKNIRKSIVYKIKNCGHMIPLERPKELAYILNNL